MGFNCLKAAEPLWGDSSHFTIYLMDNAKLDEITTKIKYAQVFIKSPPTLINF